MKICSFFFGGDVISFFLPTRKRFYLSLYLYKKKKKNFQRNHATVLKLLLTPLSHHRRVEKKIIRPIGISGAASQIIAEKEESNASQFRISRSSPALHEQRGMEQVVV